MRRHHEVYLLSLFVGYVFFLIFIIYISYWTLFELEMETTYEWRTKENF